MTISTTGEPGGLIPRHVVQFYEREDSLYALVSDFLAGGVEAGEPVIVIATEEHRRGMAANLEARGVDTSAVTFLDARETLGLFMSGGLPDRDLCLSSIGAVLSASVCGRASGRVRVYGEMVDLLWRDGNPEAAIRLEELWNEIGTVHDMALLCAYPIGSFYKETDSSLFEAVCGTHEIVLPTERISRRRDAAHLREIALLQQRAAALEAEVEHRKQLEQALRDANRMKDEFMATLSHELRTPLTAILGWARMLTLGSLDESTMQTAYETIERSARAQATLIDDLLDLSRIVTGKLTLGRELVDLQAAVENAVLTLRLAADAKDIILDVNFPSDRLVVTGDPTRLQQIVWNLLSNAVKFSPPGSTVSMTLDRDPGDRARMIVRDSGKGIRPDFLPHVFEAFRQADGASTRAHSGLGLGLAIVKHLTELHGGTVVAASEGLGHGATFTVTLPLALRRSDAAVTMPKDEVVDLTGTRVLLVDDDADTRALVSTILRRCGADVQVAESANGALDLLRGERPHVLVTDIAMPLEDGYGLLRRIRGELGSAIPVVALTASGDDDDSLREAGFHANVRKPIDPVAFARVVSAARS